MMNSKEVVEHLIKTNKNGYNLRKLIEETTELNEVVIKMLNKSEEHAPPIEKLIEEAGDVLFRLNVVLIEHKIREKVVQRTKDKGEQIAGYIEGKKYHGGV